MPRQRQPRAPRAGPSPRPRIDIDALAERVRRFVEHDDWSDPQADVDLDALVREARASSAELRRALISELGREQGLRAHAALRGHGIDGRELDSDAIQALARRALALERLATTARAALDSYIERHVLLEPISARRQLISALLAASAGGDRRGYEELRVEFEATGASVEALWRLQLARARRDHQRAALLAGERRLAGRHRPGLALRERLGALGRRVAP